MALAVIRYIVVSVLFVFDLILLTYCLASFIIRDPYNKLISAYNVILDPVLQPIRRLLNKVPFLRGIPVDFSPLVAYLICNVIKYLLM